MVKEKFYLLKEDISMTTKYTVTDIGNVRFRLRSSGHYLNFSHKRLYQNYTAVLYQFKNAVDNPTDTVNILSFARTTHVTFQHCPSMKISNYLDRYLILPSDNIRSGHLRCPLWRLEIAATETHLQH